MQLTTAYLACPSSSLELTLTDVHVRYKMLDWGNVTVVYMLASPRIIRLHSSSLRENSSSPGNSDCITSPHLAEGIMGSLINPPLLVMGVSPLLATAVANDRSLKSSARPVCHKHLKSPQRCGGVLTSNTEEQEMF